VRRGLYVPVKPTDLLASFACFIRPNHKLLAQITESVKIIGPDYSSVEFHNVRFSVPNLMTVWFIRMHVELSNVVK
jgi:hypothetical protein